VPARQKTPKRLGSDRPHALPTRTRTSNKTVEPRPPPKLTSRQTSIPSLFERGPKEPWSSAFPDMGLRPLTYLPLLYLPYLLGPLCKSRTYVDPQCLSASPVQLLPRSGFPPLTFLIILSPFAFVHFHAGVLLPPKRAWSTSRRKAWLWLLRGRIYSSGQQTPRRITTRPKLQDQTITSVCRWSSFRLSPLLPARRPLGAVIASVLTTMTTCRWRPNR